MEFFETVGETGIDSKKAVLSCGEMQSQIGEDFEKKQKKSEAMVAYLRALQWGLNRVAQNRIGAFARQEPGGFESLLETMPWTPEGGLFCSKDGFCDYIRGLICFDNAQLEEAYALFARVQVSEPDSPAFSYMQVILWIQEKEEKTSGLFNNLEAPLLKKSWCFSIFKYYILSRLEKALQQNQYNGLLLGTKESVLNQQFLVTA